MQTYGNKISVLIEPSFYIGICIMLLLIPIKWVLAWFTAIFFHEACHFFAILLLKYNIVYIKASISGVTIKTGQMKESHELIVALAGPTGSLLLLLFAEYIPALALCALFQSAYNLIPIFPYDGGRALRCIFLTVLPGETGEKMFRFVEKIVLMLLALICVCLMVRFNLGFFPILMLLSVLVKMGLLKNPCKPRKQRVQYSR